MQPVELSQYPDLDPYRAAGDPLSEAVALLEHARPRHRAAFPGWQPELRLEESDSRLVIRVALPGTRAAQVRIRIAGDLLTIEADRRLEGERPLDRGFVRSFLLPAAVPTAAVDAVLRDGTLTVTVDKRRHGDGRRIPLA